MRGPDVPAQTRQNRKRKGKDNAILDLVADAGASQATEASQSTDTPQTSRKRARGVWGVFKSGPRYAVAKLVDTAHLH
jgi:hypothetical protein